jgi:parvulin-like peptidyl-prolyl isomerase
MAVTGPRPDPRAEAVAAIDVDPQHPQQDRITARHVLVMHRESKGRPEHVTRSREQALARARECLEKLRAGAELDELVETYSDDPATRDVGGDLGPFSRDGMVRSFSDAAFALRPGEVSEVVETVYGFHIIKRTR